VTMLRTSSSATPASCHASSIRNHWLPEDKTYRIYIRF
jgi:hypothetical protein